MADETILSELIEKVEGDAVPLNTRFTIDDTDNLVLLGKINEIVAKLADIRSIVVSTETLASTTIQQVNEMLAEVNTSLTAVNELAEKSDGAYTDAINALTDAVDTLTQATATLEQSIVTQESVQEQIDTFTNTVNSSISSLNKEWESFKENWAMEWDNANVNMFLMEEKAQNALNNSKQAIETANGAMETADGAMEVAQRADTNAETALETANTAKDEASAAYSYADKANGNSLMAIDTANAASETANIASNAASVANDNASAALETAAEALSQVTEGLGSKVYDVNGNLMSSVKLTGDNGINVDMSEDDTTTFDIRLDNTVTEEISSHDEILNKIYKDGVLVTDINNKDYWEENPYENEKDVDVGHRLSDLRTDIEQAVADFNDVTGQQQDQINTNTEDISNLTTMLAETEELAQETNEGLADTNTAVETLQTEVNTNKTNISSLQSSLNNKENIPVVRGLLGSNLEYYKAVYNRSGVLPSNMDARTYLVDTTNSDGIYYYTDEDEAETSNEDVQSANLIKIDNCVVIDLGVSDLDEGDCYVYGANVSNYRDQKSNYLNVIFVSSNGEHSQFGLVTAVCIDDIIEIRRVKPYNLKNTYTISINGTPYYFTGNWGYPSTEYKLLYMNISKTGSYEIGDIRKYKFLEVYLTYGSYSYSQLISVPLLMTGKSVYAGSYIASGYRFVIMSISETASQIDIEQFSATLVSIYGVT